MRLLPETALGMSKSTIGFGAWCAGGQPPFNSGAYVHRSGTPGDPTLTCKFCSRVVTRRKDGSIARHVWEIVNESEKPGANTQATRAARAFARTRGQEQLHS